MNAKEKKIVKLPKWALWSLTIAMLLFLFGLPVGALFLGLHYCNVGRFMPALLSFLFIPLWIFILLASFVSLVDVPPIGRPYGRRIDMLRFLDD